MRHDSRSSQRKDVLVSAKLLLIAVCISAAAGASAQSPGSYPASFLKHATVVQTSGGVIVTASSPTPMLQALTAIRRQYGWIVDYEDGRYSADQIILDADNVARPRGGYFRVNVAAPKSLGSADETAFLQSLINQVAATTSQYFALKTDSSGRHTVVREATAEPLMLDTTIRLTRASRTIDDTINTIFKLISDKRGAPLVRGGLVDTGLLRATVTVGSNEERSARDLLTEALNATDVARVWSLGYEPSDGNFVIGIEVAVRAEATATGEVKVTPIWNPATSSSK
jgi:hypothetical protein